MAETVCGGSYQQSLLQISAQHLALVQPLHYKSAMPRLIRFSTSEIAMYFADHNPPHFHVLGREGAAQVRIDTLEVMELSGKVELREALD